MKNLYVWLQDLPVAPLLYFWQSSFSRSVCGSITPLLLLPPVPMGVKATTTEILRMTTLKVLIYLDEIQFPKKMEQLGKKSKKHCLFIDTDRELRNAIRFMQESQWETRSKFE